MRTGLSRPARHGGTCSWQPMEVPTVRDNRTLLAPLSYTTRKGISAFSRMSMLQCSARATRVRVPCLNRRLGCGESSIRASVWRPSTSKLQANAAFSSPTARWPENYVGMAEAAIMLMLNLQYGLRSTEEVFQGTRPRPSLDALHARTLRGSTVGLVGLGNIGLTIATLLQPFGANVIAHSPHADPLDLPIGVTLVDLEALMSESDTGCLCLAVTSSNRGLISEHMLSLMKRSAFIVNVARGSAVDETALAEALAKGSIAGTALDTFVVEPLPKESPLRQMKNVILTPHMVGQTKQAYEASFDAALQSIFRLLRGDVPAYCKNPQAVDLWRQRLGRMGNRYEMPGRLETTS